jgi:probable HAF family extracellular repeat protein
MKSHCIGRVALVAGALCLATSMATAQQYTMVTLGFAGYSGTSGGYTGLNNSGDVVGYDSWTNGAFLYTGGVVTSLGLGYGDGVAINSRGQVALQSSTSVHSYLYTPPNTGHLADLGTLGGGGGLNNTGQTYAMAMNDSGTVVGSSSYPSTTTPAWRAFAYANGAISNLGAFTPSGSSTARGVNAQGQIVGDSWSGGGYDRAFQMVNGVMTDMDPGNPAYDSQANAINDAGQIVVVTNKAWRQVWINRNKLLWVAYRGPVSYTLVYNSNGASTDLGNLGPSYGTYGESVNRAGDVVGQTYLNNVGQRAFLYHAGAMIDLNYHVVNLSGLTLLAGNNINDFGQIVCWARNPDGTTQIVVLTPVPD